MGNFEIIEHTADVGIKATGESPEEVFEQATLGLADISGIRSQGPSEVISIELMGSDRAGLLVDWLSEVLWLHDVRGAGLVSVKVDEASENAVRGQVEVGLLAERPGTQVKAITYHQLAIAQGPDGWTATVFVDV